MTDLLLTGGGTGGHTVAATVIAAVAAEAGYSVAWAGRAQSFEATVAKENGITFIPVPAYRLSAKNAARVATAIWTGRAIVKALKPRLVVATGSWVCLPVAAGAKLAGVKLAVHEQTLVPGAATRQLSRVADETWVTYAESAPRFPARQRPIQVGFPLRPVMRQAVPRAEGLAAFGLQDEPTLFVAGGGSGAETLNAYLSRHLDELLVSWQIIHQAGTAPGLTTTLEVLKQRRAELPPELAARYYVDGYFDGVRVNAALRSADLTLARAGAGFVNEVGQLQAQTVFVPYPYSVAGEQDALAKLLLPTGRVEVWDDKELREDDPARLARLLNWQDLIPTGEPGPILSSAEAAARITERLKVLLP
jgi:UDP-N-acetylglucosamine--N-acetylmuramyl-(pentapeptide) pyrophosphoryl-undecaprenol N-acetylglucosamine transferase